MQALDARDSLNILEHEPDCRSVVVYVEQSMKPYRFQIRRTKGWKKPEGGVCVSRSSRWGNPFKIGPDMSREESVHRFEEYIAAMPAEEREAFLAPLRGRPLGCWCKPNESCHADVLLKRSSDAQTGAAI